MRAVVLLVSVVLAIGPAMAECVALIGGRIVLPGENATPGTVVLRDGLIDAVGRDIAVPDGCARVDATGRVLTAGLIDAATDLGLVEIDLEASTRDGNAEGPDPFRASFRAADGYNPRSVLIPVARAGGVTSAVVSPSGGTVSGQAAWVDLTGATQADAIRRAPLAVAVTLGRPAGDALRRLRELLDDARLFSTRREAWETGQNRTFPWNRTDLEALGPVIAREIPLVVGVDRASDIEALLRLAAEQSVRVIVRGGAEAHLLARQLAAAGVPVILDPLVYGPGSFDQLHARPDNAARLRTAGVTIALSTFSAHNARKLRQIAGNAVREGLSWEDGLDAITVAPARIFGMESHGALVAGYAGNVVLWSGDPFEIDTRVEQVWIRGRSIALRSRQTELFERYRKLPATPRAPLPLPVAGR